MTDHLRPLLRNAVDVLPEGALERRLAEAAEAGRPLRVKLGLDPTAGSVTLGWSVVLSKLAAFQAAGHLPVLIVGDFTARVGDPSGKSKTRPMLTPEQIAANEADYLRQFGKILDVDRIEIRHNSEWLGELGTSGILELASRATLAQILERDDFAKRYAAKAPISLQELMYPLLQGYDSVAIAADVELGGTDQKFNLLMGRELQEQWGMPQQSIMTHALLVGTDGTQKMSQSLGNFIGLDDEPAEMYGKTMSIPDAAMPDWYRLASGLDEDDVEGRIVALESGELEPVEAKRQLAWAITARYHGDAAAEDAAEGFRRQFAEHRIPDAIPEVALGPAADVHIPALLVDHLGVPSRGEARRLIAGGAVRLDGEPVLELDLPRAALVGRVLQRGRREFVRLVAG
ncbi:MAG: tyrosine--tRNA ligase [Planctomycetota bacterium]